MVGRVHSTKVALTRSDDNSFVETPMPDYVVFVAESAVVYPFVHYSCLLPGVLCGSEVGGVQDVASIIEIAVS